MLSRRQGFLVLSLSVCLMLNSYITVAWHLAKLMQTAESEDCMFDGGLAVASLQDDTVPEVVVNEVVVADHGLLPKELEVSLFC